MKLLMIKRMMMRKRALLFEWSRINEMLDKQLYLTRLETHHRDMYFDYISLKRMVIDEIQVTRHISQAKGIGFELDFKDEQKVYTDVKWCRMMIRQVLSNSLKYSDNSTINLSGYNIEGHVVLKLKTTVVELVKEIYHVYLIEDLLLQQTATILRLLVWDYTLYKA